MPNSETASQESLPIEAGFEYRIDILTGLQSNLPDRSKFVHPEEMDRPVANCGVVGVYHHPEAAVMAYYALHSLQHRGQEAAGILVCRDVAETEMGLKRRFFAHKDHGYV